MNKWISCLPMLNTGQIRVAVDSTIINLLFLYPRLRVMCIILASYVVVQGHRKNSIKDWGTFFKIISQTQIWLTVSNLTSLAQLHSVYTYMCMYMSEHSWWLWRFFDRSQYTSLKLFFMLLSYLPAKRVGFGIKWKFISWAKKVAHTVTCSIQRTLHGENKYETKVCASSVANM